MERTSIYIPIMVWTTLSSIGYSGSQKLPRNTTHLFEANPIFRNCLEIQSQAVYVDDGLYEIFPFDDCPQICVEVYCDMTTDGGGWTVIQRRDDIQPREEFYRTWMEYARGFGDFKGEFWLGLDLIHTLTDQYSTEIRFDLMDFDDVSRWAKYDFFYVHDRWNNYTMEVANYTGDAGDSFSGHSGYSFSTKDKDFDLMQKRSCAVESHGAWWYFNCHYSNLNGYPFEGPHEYYAKGIAWNTWHGQYYSLKKTEMKIRPNGYFTPDT